MYRIDPLEGLLVDANGYCTIIPVHCPARKFAEENNLDFENFAISTGVTEDRGEPFCLDGSINCSYFAGLRAEGTNKNATVMCAFDSDEPKLLNRLEE